MFEEEIKGVKEFDTKKEEKKTQKKDLSVVKEEDEFSFENSRDSKESSGSDT